MNVEKTARMLLELYLNDKDKALAEVFHMAKSYAGTKSDMRNDFWRDVFIAIQQI